MRIDYINAVDEIDGVWFYFDGEYAGHDDQIDFGDLAPSGGSKAIDFHHRTLIDGFDYDKVGAPDTLGELEPYLNHMEGEA